MTALYCAEYILGAKYLIEFIDSISAPFWDAWFVEIITVPVSTIILLAFLIVPAKENEDAPLPSSPLVTI